MQTQFLNAILRLLPLASLGLAISINQIRAQSIYTPYAFTNFAGQPGGGGSADGTGAAARFRGPDGTAADGAGNIYVADTLNGIRKITPAGVVTRLTTNISTWPAIAADSAGNVYTVEGFTIRKSTPSGMVTTLAGGSFGYVDGTGTVARIGGPKGMVADSAGNLYLADGFAIRKVTPAGVVTTLAGHPTVFGSVDGSNSVARFGTQDLFGFGGPPHGLAVDNSGNIFVADFGNATIRKVSPVGTNWVVTTIAGSAGLAGFNDGTNSTARFFSPYGIALDNAGNVFVVDSGGQSLRKITPSGGNWVVTTIAGFAVQIGSDDGLGTAARFQTPRGATADPSGNIFVADFGNNTIRKIAPLGTNFVVTTFAGQAGGPGAADGIGRAAQFDIPHGVAVDRSNNLYVGDTFNHTIRKITPGGLVKTIAGSAGNHGYGDGVGTAEPARFNSPIGLSADSAGNLYVGDMLNQTIRKITPTAVVTTLAGQAEVIGSANGTGSGALFHNPEGTAVDSAGNIYVADNVNRTIRKITPGGDVTTLAGSTGLQGTNDGIGGAARFNQPVSVAVDSANNVYVADEGGQTIRKITPGGAVTTLAGLGGRGGTNDGVGSAARFLNPQGVAVDAAGKVYVSDSGNHTIRMITPAGAVTTMAGTAGQTGSADGTNGVARFGTPRGIAVDSATNIYVADGNSTVRKLVVTGTNCVVTTLAGTADQNGSVDGTGSAARFHFPYGLAVDAARNVYVVDRSNVDIRKITPDGVVTTFAGVPGQTGSADGTGAAAQFYNPEELTVDSAGNIYVVEFGNSTVRKIAPNGTNWIVTTVAGCASCAVGTNDGVGIAARFNNPFGLTRDSSGNVYVADTNSRTIRKITPNGTNWTVTTFAGKFGLPTMDGTGTAAGFNGPIGLAIDAANNLYVADGFAIRKITPAAVVTTLAGCPPPGCTNALGSTDGSGSVARFGGPRAVAADSAGNLYVADAGNNTIRKLTLSGSAWTVTTLAGLTGQPSGADGVGSEARFNQPSGVAVDSAGNVYVVDAAENRVTRGTAVSLSPSFQFGSSAGSLTVSNGAFQMRLTSSSSSNIVVVIEASINLQSWTPIRTNTLSAGALDVSVLVGTNQHQFFRARPGP